MRWKRGREAMNSKPFNTIRLYEMVSAFGKSGNTKISYAPENADLRFRTRYQYIASENR